MQIKIATWNVNSIKARLPNAIKWLKESQADVVLLQEIKCITDNFPYTEIEELGYNIVAHGQKTYNGVAILSKFPIEDVVKGLAGDESDEQARYIEAVISVEGSAIRVASIYVPNGSSPDSDKFIYKMKFFDRLRSHAKELLRYDEILILGGDYNVAPTDIDVYDPESLSGSICFHPDEQEKFRSLEYVGLTDAFRAKYPDSVQYSWWDYRGGGWQNNKGMRIDHLMLSPQAADMLVACEVDDNVRGGEKASDHAPVCCTIEV